MKSFEIKTDTTDFFYESQNTKILNDPIIEKTEQYNELNKTKENLISKKNSIEQEMSNLQIQNEKQKTEKPLVPLNQNIQNIGNVKSNQPFVLNDNSLNKVEKTPEKRKKTDKKKTKKAVVPNA